MKMINFNFYFTKLNLFSLFSRSFASRTRLEPISESFPAHLLFCNAYPPASIFTVSLLGKSFSPYNLSLGSECLLWQVKMHCHMTGFELLGVKL